VSAKFPGFPGAIVSPPPTWLHGPVVSRLHTRAVPSILTGVLSVFRLGLVQVSVTALPARVAAKSVTGSGKFSDGGCGAPGVPHPETKAHSPTVSAAHAIRSDEIIAFSLMERDRCGPVRS